jgi:hypothetical protein
VELGNRALPLYTSMPQGEIRDGEYPVNYSGAVRKASGGRERRHLKGSLFNAFAPCLIHMLEAAFAGHVIEALDAQGVRDIVAINDCFLVPSDALPTLSAATKAAGRPWFLSLGPFYDVFEHYLGDDPVYGPRVGGWREIWQRRVDAGNDWPQLLMKRETTFEFVW